MTTINATRRILSTMAVISLVALTAMAEERAAIPTAGLTITKALAGKVDVTKVLAAKVKGNRLVIVATTAWTDEVNLNRAGTKRCGHRTPNQLQ